MNFSINWILFLTVFLILLIESPFNPNRIENAGCVSCFLDFAQSITDIKKRLIDFRTNIILCDSESVTKFNAGIGQVEVTSNITLFDRSCVLVRFQGITLNTNRLLDNDMNDKSKSSNIFFYATTSGSCGEVKPIGVTYKCFSPNVTSMGWVWCKKIQWESHEELKSLLSYYLLNWSIF